MFRHAPLESALALVAGHVPPPSQLSPAAAELIQEALAKGCVELLVREGAWGRDRFLRNGDLVEGRLWERFPSREFADGLHIAEISPGGE